MPKRRIEIVLDTRGGVDVKDEFTRLYGGSDANWRWLKRKLDGMDPAELRNRCVKLGGPNPCDLFKLLPCYVFGQLRIGDETAWWEGLEAGTFLIEAVTHDDFAAAYYQARVTSVPDNEQDV